ncbi:MAG: hypothetical protein JO212_19945 [Acetobacteraceae bacterium]|nr:hypothetical protein [Acetobacteraceae bacterium]
MEQAYNNGEIVTGDAAISPPADAPLISTDSTGAGLWLWQGDAPAAPSRAQLKSSDPPILYRMMHAAGWAGWIALPIGLALTFIAISVMRHPEKPVSAEKTAVGLSPVLAPAVVSPSVVPAPAEPKETQSDQSQVPSAPPAQTASPSADTQAAKSHAHRISSHTIRKTHASPARRGPPILVPGVLTPPPMTSHGGGY